MFRVLDAIDDAKLWKEILSTLPPDSQDIYFLPEYCALELGEGLATGARMFVFQQGERTWVYPFLMKKIGRVGDCVLENEWFDLESQYGYAGPLANNNEPEFLSESAAVFSEWCQQARIVSEFVRLHPLILNERWLDPKVEVVYDRATVSLNLNRNSAVDVGESGFSKTARYMVRRAQRGGLKVIQVSDPDSFSSFVRLYRDTMERLNADRYYYFDELYFERLRRLIDENGWLLLVTAEDKVVAAGVFLKGQKWVHYHLSGSAGSAQYPGATNLLIYHAAELAREKGYTRMHLGGGTTGLDSDPLLKFKASMATDSHRFGIGKRIHNLEIYQRLKLAWQEANPSLVSTWGNRLLCYRVGMTTN